MLNLKDNFTLAQIVLMVGHYINTHQISEEESEIISEAIQAKSEVERSKGIKYLSNDISPSSSNIIKPPIDAINDNFSNSQLKEIDQSFKINNKQSDKKDLSIDNKSGNFNDVNTVHNNCPQPEHLYALFYIKKI